MEKAPTEIHIDAVLLCVTGFSRVFRESFSRSGFPFIDQYRPRVNSLGYLSSIDGSNSMASSFWTHCEYRRA